MSIRESATPRATASIGGHPIHAILMSIPITCFIGTLITDIVYWQTADMLWSDMSSWLLTAGLVVAVFAVIAGIVDFFGDRRVRTMRAAWIHGLGNALALVLEIINAFVHTRDAYTSVVPEGLILSAVSVLIFLITAWSRGRLVYQRDVEIRANEEALQ